MEATHPRQLAHTATAPPTAVIVEDEWAVAAQLQRGLQRAGFSVLGLAASGAEAVAQINRHRPNLVVMDIGLPGELDGIQVAATMDGAASIPVLYVTGRVDEATLARASTTNVMGYVVKPFDERQLQTAAVLAITRAGVLSRTAGSLQKHRATEQALQTIAGVLQEMGIVHASGWETKPGLSALSRREMEVMRRLVNNARVSTIARVLHLSPHTVRNHLKTIYRKLGVHSQTELIEWTRRQ